MRYFDYEKVAEEAKLSPEQLALLSEIARKDFPTDDMLYELYLLRMCMAIASGHLTLSAALKPEPEPISFAQMMTALKG